MSDREIDRILEAILVEIRRLLPMDGVEGLVEEKRYPDGATFKSTRNWFTDPTFNDPTRPLYPASYIELNVYRSRHIGSEEIVATFKYKIQEHIKEKVYGSVSIGCLHEFTRTAGGEIIEIWWHNMLDTLRSVRDVLAKQEAIAERKKRMDAYGGVCQTRSGESAVEQCVAMCDEEGL